MKTTKTKILTGLATLAVAGFGSALKLPAQSNPYQSNSPDRGMDSAGRYISPLSGKFYVGFDAGVAWQQDMTLSDTVGDSEKVTFDPGARLDWQLGYSFTKNWAAELEFGLIISPVKSSYTLEADYMNVDLVQLPVLVNVIYSHPLGKHFSVYAGGGIGGVFSDYENDYGGTTEAASAFAYQGLAGIKYTINAQWDIGVGYKFLGTTGYDVGSGIAWDEKTHTWVSTEFHSDGNMVHSILLTVTCRF